MELPTPRVQLYDEDGCPNRLLTYSDQQAIESETTPTEEKETQAEECRETQLQASEQEPVHETVSEHLGPEPEVQTQTSNEDVIHTLQPKTIASNTQQETQHASEVQIHGETQPKTDDNNDDSETRLVLDSVEEEHTVQYKTKHASQIATVIGNIPELITFDDMRHQLKTQRPMKDQKTKHDKLLAELQVLVQRERTKIMQEIKDFELEYYKEHTSLPSDHSCPQYKQLLTKYKHASKLLAMWNILI